MQCHNNGKGAENVLADTSFSSIYSAPRKLSKKESRKKDGIDKDAMQN